MTEYPSLPDQAKNLVHFASNVITSKESLFTTDEVKAQRLHICKSCEHYDAQQIRCKSCGCFLLAKASFTFDSCPLHKWNSMAQETKQEESINLNKPTFPNHPEINEIYTWNQVSWVWNGKRWDLNTETVSEQK